MTENLRDLMQLYALGILEPELAAEVERAIANDPEERAIALEYQRAAEGLAPAIAPSPEVKRRLLASIGGGRFERFANRIATLFDVTLDRGRELLGLIERSPSWEVQIPGVSLVHFEGGPAAAAADCGFIRIAPGAMFPPHTHRGEEVAIVLAGRVHDGANHRTLGPGDEYAMAADTSHDLVCVGDEDCIYAVRARNGIAVGGVPVSPIKPG